MEEIQMKDIEDIFGFDEKFDKEFDNTIRQITIVTGSAPVSAMKGERNKYNKIYLEISAWKFIDSNKIFKGNYTLTGKVKDKQLDQLFEKLESDIIISLKVRQKDNEFFLVEIITDKENNEELEKVLKEQTKPMFYVDKILGKFILDKKTDLYIKKQKWNNTDIELMIRRYAEKKLPDIFFVANELVKKQMIWDKLIKEFAVKKLLKIKNESWLEDEEKITSEQFIQKMKLKSIVVSMKNKFEFCFDDGDIFFGHFIMVDGNLEKGPLRAEIYG